jgi:hypothetical protein
VAGPLGDLGQGAASRGAGRLRGPRRLAHSASGPCAAGGAAAGPHAS